MITYLVVQEAVEERDPDALGRLQEDVDEKVDLGERRLGFMWMPKEDGKRQTEQREEEQRRFDQLPTVDSKGQMSPE